MRPKYLFVRILEACNADCFMCGFARSRDPRRFTPADLERLLPAAIDAGVRYIRYTGGEPLMNADLPDLVRMAASAGLKTSVITNGMLLPQRARILVSAGLSQVIVSLDGASAATHDVYRATPGCFGNALEGIGLARAAGLRTRVNTVVGPHNYAEIPAMQQVFTGNGIQQWELSAIKLERPVVYDDPADVVRVGESVYQPEDPALLVPLGKRFYGDTPAEQSLFFERSITPRASQPLCHVTDDVIFYDPINQRSYACSCLAYRDDGVPTTITGPGGAGANPFTSPPFLSHASLFRTEGPRMCTGCSTTAAGYSDDIAGSGEVPEWRY